MGRRKKKKWIEIFEGEDTGRSTYYDGDEEGAVPGEELYYDEYETGAVPAGEPEYYDEDDEDEAFEEEPVYYEEYDEELCYDEYGEEGASEEACYDGYGEEGASEEACYDGYGEEGASEEACYDEYGEEGASEEACYDGYGEEGASEEACYDGYDSAAAVEEEPAYYEGYEQDTVLEEGDYRPKKKYKRLLFLFALLFFIGVAGGFLYAEMPRYFVKEELTVEAGTACPSAADFLKHGDGGKATLSGISEDTVFEHVEDIPVTVHVYLWDVPSVVHVTDTVAPELVTKDREIMLGEPFEVDDFVEHVSDITSCEVSWETEPVITAGGVYTVVLEAVDEGGNRTRSEAGLTVVEDTTAPVIEGVQELTAGVGKSVSYKRGITVTDDHDEDVTLEIDNSRVDLDTPGDYEVVYSATDKAGNKTEISTILHVIEEPMVGADGEEIVVTEEMVNAQADKILAEITDSSMSQYEVIQAIYNWCNKKIAYLDGVPKTNWVMGAYEGLIERRGDCFTFAMSSKCLLNRAGITNMDIERVRVGDSMHFWNLVDIGEGWHHFDTCRRGDGATFFYLTDAELMAYSEAHISAKYPNGTHYYDRSLYPEIP